MSEAQISQRMEEVLAEIERTARPRGESRVREVRRRYRMALVAVATASFLAGWHLSGAIWLHHGFLSVWAQ